MKVAVIGAGFAGLSTAKVLKSCGHQVTVFEKEPNVGGVWSASRRYPGLTTQNVRSTYAFSDFPYPPDYPEWPSGEQVQRYLESYVRHFDLQENLRLRTPVTLATIDEKTRIWTVETARAGIAKTETFDYLVVCNGIFCDPAIPRFEGDEHFVSSGGLISHTSELNQLQSVENKNVLVVGYGKSACDVAQAVSTVAASTTVVARKLIWKVPKKLMNVVNYKYLLLTRLGEGLFKYQTLKGVEKFLHGLGKPIRDSMLAQVQWVVTQQCQLKRLGLLPDQPFETVARSTVSLVTDGFYESVASGKIKVKKNDAIVRIVPSAEPSTVQSIAELASGDRLPLDVIICGTGWNQSVPFFSQALNERLLDTQGNFCLYRSMLPIDIPNLAFNGYNSSLFSQLNCEIGALWIASWMDNLLSLPSKDVQTQIVATRLAWMNQFTQGKHAKGTNIIPFSVHHLDELLADMQMTLSPLIRLKQWLLPIDPRDFAFASQSLVERLRSSRESNLS